MDVTPDETKESELLYLAFVIRILESMTSEQRDTVLSKFRNR